MSDDNDDTPSNLDGDETNRLGEQDVQNVAPMLNQMIEQVAERFFRRQATEGTVLNERMSPHAQIARLSDVPMFYGEPCDKMTFDEWRVIFERIAKANVWSDIKKLNLVPLKFANTALKVFDGLSLVQKNNYEAAMKRMSDLLESSKSGENLLNQLCNRTQKSFESVVTFAYDLNSLVSKMTKISDNDKETLTIKFFLRGLLPRIKQHMNAEYVSFMEATEAAKKFEDSFAPSALTTTVLTLLRLP